MAAYQHESTLKSLRAMLANRHDEDLGRLAVVPRYQTLHNIIQDASSRSCYVVIHETMQRLGRAMQLRQHRHLIETLDAALGRSTLTAMTSISLNDPEVRAAFANYLTTLEQAYHWPGDSFLPTPETLEDHKLVIQMLNQPQLRKMLNHALALVTSCKASLIPADKIAQTALLLARSILDEIRLTLERGDLVSPELQDTVNLLHRTCRSDWNDQGDYRDIHSHKEFGRLHEVKRASGTQRRLQELFQHSSGLLCLQAMPELLKNVPNTSDLLTDALTQLQYSIALIREELFAVCVDEVIWGRAFANFSKAVGFCDVSASGGDGPVFWMLDSLCGQSNPHMKAGLPEALQARSRFFPSNMQNLVARIRGVPDLRAYCTSSAASPQLQQAFKALERQRYELYEMHRKKAARISVSLRAGQRGTSAGVGCPYASPDKALATTLSAGVAKRFGDDMQTTLIDATARAHSLMYDEDGLIYSARVRFDFSAPLVLGPGDCLLVNVQDKTGEWQTRTYSITYTYLNSQPLETDAHQLTGAAEVYIRSKGEISSFLCSQTQGCKVLAAVKPASHFRLEPNASAKDTTVFVAQGGALGIFVAWLQPQKQLTGQYNLIVASRKFKQLGFKNELIKLAGSLTHNLKVVVVLSRPDSGDVALLESAGIETFQGRVNAYLNGCSFDGFRSAYVCGTSSFGLEVAKSRSLAQDNGKERRRLEAITTSELPPIRLHVAPENIEAKELPEICLAELAQHNSASDLWVAVGNSVYDITTLSKFHPGGEKILMVRAGRRADDIFDSVHGGSVDVESMLQSMIVGRLTLSNANKAVLEQKLDKIVEIQNDLTNHTRYEKMPGFFAGDLDETTPTHVIYASLECMTKDWCLLLEANNLSKSLQCQLMRAWLGLRKKLDASQAACYQKSFQDVGRCEHVLQQVFEHLRSAAAEIQTILDSVKIDIARCIADNKELSGDVLEACSKRIVAAIDQQASAVVN